MDDPRTPAAGLPDAVPTPGDVHRVVTHGWSHGGRAVGRLADGRACFIAGALPDEQVSVRITAVHKRHAEGVAVEVHDAHPDRTEPPCPYVPECGGCDLQHATPALQRSLKRRVLVEQLQRIARIADPPVADDVAVVTEDAAGYRDWARMAVTTEGGLGFRRGGSHDVIGIDRCLLLSDPAQQLRDAAGDRWDGASEVTLSASPGGGQGVLRVSGDLPDPVPDGDFGLVTDAGVRREPAMTEVLIDGHRLRVSAGAFFQSGAAGAAVLVEAVLGALDLEPDDRLVDLYAGVGLFSVVLAPLVSHVTAVESSAAACADARANLDGQSATVVEGDCAAVMERWDGPLDVVLLDPPRQGANQRVCAAIAARRPRQVVYVACDPAALARDARTLGELGYRLDGVQAVDLFGHTSHVEAVASFSQGPAS